LKKPWLNGQWVPPIDRVPPPQSQKQEIFVKNVEWIICSFFCICLLTCGNYAKAENNDSSKHEMGALEKKIEGLFQAGVTSMRNKDFQEAINYFKQYTDIKSKNGGAYANMAVANIYLQNFSEAIENLDRAKELGVGGLEDIEKTLVNYRMKEYSMKLYEGHNIKIKGNSNCSEQLIRDVLLAGLGIPTVIDAKFIQWDNGGKIWVEKWALSGDVLSNNVTVSFYVHPDGGTTFIIKRN
jgi:hypothetical protein